MKKSHKIIFGIEVIFLIFLIIFIFIQCFKSKKIVIPHIEKQPIEAIIPIIKPVDTIPIVYIIHINQDSLERAQLIKDSIAFRKACKAINGGYNGFKQRYDNWLRIRKVLNNKINK